MRHEVVSRAVRQNNGGRAIQSATPPQRRRTRKTADKPSTITAGKKDGGQARQRRVNLRSIDNRLSGQFHMFWGFEG